MAMKPANVAAHGYDKEEFENLLTAAEHGATSDRSMEFVEQMKAKFKDYGLAAFLSEAQHDWLLKLAGE